MIKLKVSYEHKEELLDFLPVIRKHLNISKLKIKKEQKGKYKIAYIELENMKTTD